MKRLMQRTPSLLPPGLFWIVLAATMCGTASADTVQEARKARGAVTAPVDRAQEAIRREVAAKAKESKAIFERLKALPAPVAAPPMLVGQVIVQQQNVAMIEEIVLDGEDGPPRRVYTEQAFDAIVFGGAGRENYRLRWERVLDQSVGAAGRIYTLTFQQRRKLELAGKGDLKRHLDRIEGKRKEFATIRMDMPSASLFLRDLAQQRSTERTLFGDGSLYAKVLNTITEAEAGRDEDDQPGWLFPGNKLELQQAAERAHAVVVVRDLKLLGNVGTRDHLIWCADVTVTQCLKGKLAPGKLRLNAIPVSHSESLPKADDRKEYILFIERSEGRGITLHRVTKMLPFSKRHVHAVIEALER